MMNKEASPFTPGFPVPLELFVGRRKQIEEILRYIKQSSSGRLENIFLIGDKGIGKSSLASFIKHYVNIHTDIIGVHVFLGRVSTLEGLVHYIFDQLLKETRNQSWYKNLIDFFGKHVKEIGLFGISVSFNPSEQMLKELVQKFPEVLCNLLNKLKSNKKGLFIILDDINGLSENINFANWYKSFVDEVATHYTNFPVAIMLAGTPDKRDTLYSIQNSLSRIFRVIQIEKLSDDEVRDFFGKAFKRTGIEVLPSALNIMTHYSSGLPLLMHEIGDAVFWLDDDMKIDENDCLDGIISAAEKVGEKYLDPKIYRTIRSERYRSILRKLGEISIERHFKKKEIEEKLTENEKKVFHNFLKKMKDSGIIESDIEKGVGAYKFVNEIYPIYINLESQKFKKRNKK